MKSYADDIPNVSTEELKRTASLTEHSNDLLKQYIVKLEEHEGRVNEQLIIIKKVLRWNTIMLAVTTVAAAGFLVFIAMLNTTP